MTTIGPSLLITGEITSQEDVTLHGRINGHVRMREGALIVAPKAYLEGDVHGARVTVHGTVAGDVTCADRIELTPTADVRGTITAPKVILQEGATFHGRIDMNRIAQIARAS